METLFLNNVIFTYVSWKYYLLVVQVVFKCLSLSFILDFIV